MKVNNAFTKVLADLFTLTHVENLSEQELMQ